MDYFLQLLHRHQAQQEGWRAHGGGGGGGGDGGRARAATQREISDAMIAKAEQYLFLILGCFLTTEQGRKLLMSEAAAQHLIVFVLSLATFIFLVLILRIDFNDFTITNYIGDCTAFLRVMIFMSLIGTFMHDKLPWITYTPLLFLPMLLVRALAGQGAAGGGDDGRAHAARRQTSDTMLAKVEQILNPVVATFLVTEEGKKLMMSEAAAQHQMVLALSTAGFNILALIRRFDFTGFFSPYIDDCAAILKATMLMSLIGTFVGNKLAWVTYIPVLLYVFLLIVRALVHIFNRQGLINEDLAAARMD